MPAYYVRDRDRPPPLLVEAADTAAAVDHVIRRRRDDHWQGGECDGTDFRAIPTTDPRAYRGERFAARREGGRGGRIVPRLDDEGREVIVETWTIDAMPAEEMPRMEPVGEKGKVRL